jgi:hypothetical protein
MANTGYKGWRILEQFDDVLNTLTGLEKPNVTGDPDYIAPVLNTEACPLPPQYENYVANATAMPSCSTGYEGSSEPVAGTANGPVIVTPGAERDAAIAALEEQAEINAQANANATCELVVPAITVQNLRFEGTSIKFFLRRSSIVAPAFEQSLYVAYSYFKEPSESSLGSYDAFFASGELDSSEQTLSTYGDGQYLIIFTSRTPDMYTGPSNQTMFLSP